jgi:hypothetical protein
MKENLRYHPESFLTGKGFKTNFFNVLNVHKVTILPYGQSLGHTAMLYNKDILSQNKKDMMKMIGKQNVNKKTLPWEHVHWRNYYWEMGK